ncbi:response regulator [Lysinibacillus sp. LZ02]|uniref:response regulator n=1 Tax=Lysinibacillus sp. LZ02 TaxID=3420668 RepID=UPI003D363A31
MNVILIDDEKLALDILGIMLNEIAELPIYIKGMFVNVKDAFDLLKTEKIDVAFLDMEMADMHGLQVAKQLQKYAPNIQIIFVTAHAHFAVEAFNVEAIDYLLKPVNKKRLVKALRRANQLIVLGKDSLSQKTKFKMYARTLGRFQLLDVNGQTVNWRTRKVRELFLYLWFHQQRPVSNAVLTEELWPNIEHEKASVNLHTAIYQLRKLFKQNGVNNPIQLVNNHYQFDIEISSDYAELMSLLEQSVHEEQDIQQILNLYNGDFLEEEEYHWAIQMRAYIKQKVLHLLESYVTNVVDAKSLLKLNCLQKMLVLDEYNEYYMLVLMKFLTEQNKKMDCIRLYDSIRKKLEEELGVEIPQQIQQIYYNYMTTQA